MPKSTTRIAADFVPQVADVIVSGHVRAGNTQLASGTSNLANYYVSGTIGEYTWTTIGPTGSGATKIWTALDVLPTEATILLTSVFISVSTNSSAQPGQMRAYAASGDVADRKSVV